jgi:hypothetical protein
MKLSFKVVIRSTLFILLVAAGYNNRFGFIPALVDSTGMANKSQSLLNTSSCGEYREYPWPEHHTGLPWLADVFSTHDAQSIIFISLNRGQCLEEWKDSDNFHADQGIAHRFICVFPDGSAVLSDFVHTHSLHPVAHIIRCKIPTRFQYLVSDTAPQTFTKLHVDLHAIEDLEVQPLPNNGYRPFPSMEITDSPKLAQLPICPALTTTRPTRKYQLTTTTRIKSTWVNGQRRVDSNSTLKLDKKQLGNWMAYHKKMGVDHFILYDNDEIPHGPIEQYLQPYIDSGEVTYIWFPLKDCTRDHGGWEGITHSWGQVATTLSAMHRFGFNTEYFAHLDIDEYYITYSGNLVDFVRDQFTKSNNTVDVLHWTPSCMGPCNGTVVSSQQSVMSKWRCFTGSHYADKKTIFWAERLWNLFVHYPLTTPEGTLPNIYSLNETTEGFLAHYRSQDDMDEMKYFTHDFVGPVSNDLTDRLHFMDRFCADDEVKCLNFELP